MPHESNPRSSRQYQGARLRPEVNIDLSAAQGPLSPAGKRQAALPPALPASRAQAMVLVVGTLISIFWRV
jgi:hypothetical protein